MAKLSIRVDIDGEGRLGPGKIALMEALAEHKSISAAGRSMAMSYKRAWDLVAELNDMFAKPVIVTQPGGRDGGGAQLTDFGRVIIEHYRAIERLSQEAASVHLDALQKGTRRRERTP